VHIQSDFHAPEGFGLHAHLQLPLSPFDLADQPIGQGLAHTVREQLGLFGLLLESGPRGIGRGLWRLCGGSGRGTLARAG
jgi:hypothetical protein